MLSMIIEHLTSELHLLLLRENIAPCLALDHYILFNNTNSNLVAEQIWFRKDDYSTYGIDIV